MSFLDKLRNSPDEKEIKRRAEEFQAKQGMTGPDGQQFAEEQGAVEGDVTDYVMPFKGLGKNIIKSIAEKGVKEGAKAVAKVGAKEVVKDTAQAVKNKTIKDTVRDIKQPEQGPRKPEVAGPDYKKENIAFRPTEPGKQVGWERFSMPKKKP